MHHLWHIAVGGLGLLLSLWATVHVALNKRDTSAAIAWVGFVWLVPFLGPILYAGFGVNRLRHKAAHLRRNLARHRAQAAQAECLPQDLPQHLPACSGHLAMVPSPSNSRSGSRGGGAPHVP